MKYVYSEGKEILEDEVKKEAFKVYLSRMFSGKRGDTKSDWFSAIRNIVRDREEKLLDEQTRYY